MLQEIHEIGHIAGPVWSSTGRSLALTGGMREHGLSAARLMLSLLLDSSPTAVKQVLLTPELIVRGSTRRPSSARTK
jgi:hypothetical protein